MRILLAGVIPPLRGSTVTVRGPPQKETGFRAFSQSVSAPPLSTKAVAEDSGEERR